MQLISFLVALLYPKLHTYVCYYIYGQCSNLDLDFWIISDSARRSATSSAKALAVFVVVTNHLAKVTRRTSLKEVMG